RRGARWSWRGPLGGRRAVGPSRCRGGFRRGRQSDRGSSPAAARHDHDHLEPAGQNRVSYPCPSIESMFGTDGVVTSAAAVVDRICSAARAESRAAGQRLVAIGELDSLWVRGGVADEQWVLDSFVAVSAEVAAAL